MQDEEGRRDVAAGPDSPLDMERARALTVTFLDGLRSDYRGTTRGERDRDVYETLATRVVSTIARKREPRPWCSEMVAQMGVPAPGSSTSSAIVEMCRGIHGRAAERAWAHMVRDEWGLLVAETRLASEARHEKREAARRERTSHTGTGFVSRAPSDSADHDDDMEGRF